MWGLGCSISVAHGSIQLHCQRQSWHSPLHAWFVAIACPSNIIFFQGAHPTSSLLLLCCKNVVYQCRWMSVMTPGHSIGCCMESACSVPLQTRHHSVQLRLPSFLCFIRSSCCIDPAMFGSYSSLPLTAVLWEVVYNKMYVGMVKIIKCVYRLGVQISSTGLTKPSQLHPKVWLTGVAVF